MRNRVWPCLLALLLAGCLSPAPAPTPRPTPAPTPTPTATPLATVLIPLPSLPTANATPTLAPTPLPTALVTTQPSCTEEGKCLSKTPQFCSGGRVVENCGLCGCPAGARCARPQPLASFTCLSYEWPGENYTPVIGTPVPPKADCVPADSVCTDNSTCCNATFACSWNATKVGRFCQSSATPTPAATPAPAPSVYSVNEMLAKVGAAYQKVFSTALSWFAVEENRSYTYSYRGPYDADIYLTKGFYSGFPSTDRLVQVEAPTNHWVQTFALEEGNPIDQGYYYNFRMECFNWTYRVEGKITEHETGRPAYWGRNFTPILADNCPP